MTLKSPMLMWRQKLSEARLPGSAWIRATALLTVGISGLYEGFWKLGTRDWYHDEVRYLDVARAYLAGDFSNRQDLESYVHPPLGKYLFAVGEALLGLSPGEYRVVPALIGVAIGVILFIFARHVASFWAGLLAAGLWVLVPHPALASENLRRIGTGIASVGGYDVGRTIVDRYERYGILDVPAALFAAIAMFMAWRWSETGRWRHIALAAATLGLAIASKVPAALVAPALMTVGLVALPRDRRLAAQLAAFPAIAAAVFLLTYLPFGLHAPEAIWAMFAFQVHSGAQGMAVKPLP